jgi:hypothetical protein
VDYPGVQSLEDAVRIISRASRSAATPISSMPIWIDSRRPTRDLHDRIGRERAVHLYERTIEVVGPLVSRASMLWQLAPLQPMTRGACSRK